MAPIVIVGAGMAAYSLAREFRKRDTRTPLMLVAADAGGAYSKPMLSNAIALGKGARQLVTHSAAQMAAPILSHGLVQAWKERAITLRLGTAAASVDHAGGALRVTLADGTTVDADLVLSAVGLRPSIALAQSALLATRRGIVVDAYGQASGRDVYALGDCTEYSTGAGSAVLPYVAPLLTAARAIAATLAGIPTPIALKADAVIVKTPSYRLALAPPSPGTAGSWVAQADGAHTIARFLDEQGVLRGFGMSPHTPALRQRLLAELG